MYALQFFSLFVNNNYTLVKFLKTASLCDIAQICVFYVASLPSLSDMPGVERIDRTRQSSSVLEFAQWREAKKESSRRETKSGGKGKGWNCLLVWRELLFGNIFGPNISGKHIALSSNDLLAHPGKRTGKIELQQACSREILKIYDEAIREVLNGKIKRGAL